MKALIVVIMGGVGNLLGALVAGPDPRPRRDRGRAPGRSRPDARGQLRALPRRAAGAADRPVREGGAVSRRELLALAPLRLVAVALLAACRSSPAATSSRSASACCSYAVLATAWALFSGPDPLHLARHRRLLRHRRLHRRRARRGAAVAAGAGDRRARSASPSRSSSASRRCGCRGIYFVIFTFGLAELIRQLVTWYEVNIHRTVGRYIFLDITQAAHLLAAPRARRRWCSSPAG